MLQIIAIIFGAILRPHCDLVGFVMRVTDVYKSTKTHITLDINPNHSRRLIIIRV